MALKEVTAYLGLGSNMGERRKNLETALELLSKELQIIRLSSIYDTEPVGVVNQQRFLNMVCEVRTTLAPREFLKVAKDIERKMGRKPSRRNAPRPIDIDILFYGDEIIGMPELVVPHSRLTERAFVLIPLAEIAPDLIHPMNHKTIAELRKGVSGVEGVIEWEENNVSNIRRVRF